MPRSPASYTDLTLATGASTVETKAGHLRAVMKERILDGTYPPGSKLDPERTLESRFKVSRLTVNKVLSILVAEGLLERVAGRGTYVTRMVSRRSDAKTGQLAFVFCEPLRTLTTNRFYGRLLEAAYGEARARGFRLVLEHAPEAMRLMGSEGRVPEVDGFLAVAIEDERLITSWRETGMPVVLCDHEDEGKRCDAVVLDHAAAGRALAAHLLSRGYRRVGMVNERHYSQGGTQVARAREEALREALALQGATLDVGDVVRIPDRSPQSVLAIEQFLNRAARPQALVLFHDLYAPLVARAMSRLGLSCPKDLAVASFAVDDEPVVGLPAITGARFSPETLGAMAMAQLVERIERPDRETARLRLPPEFVDGGSA